MKKSTLSLSSCKLEDFLYLNNIKIKLKRNKTSCLCELIGWLIKTKRNNLKPPSCNGKTLMEAFVGMALIISKKKLYSIDEKKSIKVPNLK